MKLPPYAREINQAKRNGKLINLFIYAGRDAWRFAQARPPGGRLAVPEDTDWRQMDFTCVRGLEPVVVARGWDQGELDAFGRHLILSGARLVVGLLVIRDAQLDTVIPTHYRLQSTRQVAA